MFLSIRARISWNVDVRSGQRLGHDVGDLPLGTDVEYEVEVLGLNPLAEVCETGHHVLHALRTK